VGRQYHLLAVTRDEVATDDAGDEVAARERLSAAMSTVESRLAEHRRRSDARCEALNRRLARAGCASSIERTISRNSGIVAAIGLGLQVPLAGRGSPCAVARRSWLARTVMVA
jgi:hypothetical protein